MLRTKPLLELTKKGMKWRWEDDHQKVFEEVQTLFVKNIILHHLQKEGSFVIYADASKSVDEC